ncbi:MAG: YHS domain-containing protein, partial [Rhizobiales bacterium]|nr:YHS domain-containing protein [Hyphomicrobiales bacterium]
MRSIYPYGVTVSRIAIVHEPAQFSSEVDPVCGMGVDPAKSAHKFAWSGWLFHFCSAGCRSKFVADPKKFLNE